MEVAAEFEALRTQMAEIADRRAIEELLLRYCRAFDRRDVPAAIATHWPDAQVDYPSGVCSAEDMARGADHIHGAQFDSTQHYVTNTLIELDGDTAHAETYFIMAGRLKDSFDAMLVGGRYVRRVERRKTAAHPQGEWRIASCVCMAEWSNLAGATESLLAHSALASRDQGDWAFHRPLEVTRKAFSRTEI